MEADGQIPDHTLVHEASQAIRLHEMAFDQEDQDGLYRATATAWRTETGRDPASGRPLEPAEKFQEPAKDFLPRVPEASPVPPAPVSPRPRSGEQGGFAMPGFDAQHVTPGRRR